MELRNDNSIRVAFVFGELPTTTGGFELDTAVDTTLLLSLCLLPGHHFAPVFDTTKDLTPPLCFTVEPFTSGVTETLKSQQ